MAEMGQAVHGFGLNVADIEHLAEPYRVVAKLPPVIDSEIRGDELFGKVPGTDDWKPIRYLVKLITFAQGPPTKAIQKFRELLNHCVKHGKVGYGQLTPMVLVPLARISSDERAMLTVCVLSDYTNDELNEWLKVECFVDEGDLPNSAWPDIGD